MIRMGDTALSCFLLLLLLAAGHVSAQELPHAEEKFNQIRALDEAIFKLPEKDRITGIKNPATNVVMARHRADWPMFDSWATPQFYLLKDGKVLDKFSGWPLDGNGNRERLIELLSKGGLLARKPA